MLPKYNPFEFSLMRVLYYPGALANTWIFFYWRFVSTLSLPGSILCLEISLVTCTEAHGLFQTIQLSHNTLYFLYPTLYSAVSFVFVELLLFWFSIFFVTLLDNVAYGLLSLIAHTDNSCHELDIFISVGLLLLVVGHYRSSLIRLLYQFSSGLSSSIFMLLNVLSCCSTYFSDEGITYTLALCRLWWVGVWYYLLLSFHWFLATVIFIVVRMIYWTKKWSLSKWLVLILLLKKKPFHWLLWLNLQV